MSFADQMASGFIEILKSPGVNLNALWLLIPIFILWIFMVVYFGIYSKEHLAWEDVLSEGISLAWIMVSLLAFLFGKTDKDWLRIGVIIGFLVYALFLMVMTFLHGMNEQLAVFLSSPTVSMFLSWIAVVWSYGSLEMSWPVFIDFIILCAMVTGVVELILYIRRRVLLRAEGGEESPEEELPEELEEEPEEPKA